MYPIRDAWLGVDDVKRKERRGEKRSHQGFVVFNEKRGVYTEGQTKAPSHDMELDPRKKIVGKKTGVGEKKQKGFQ